MKSDKPVLERADKIAIAVAVALFFVFSGLLMNDCNKRAKELQAEKTQNAVEKAKTNNVTTIKFYQQNTK
jgi:hypothetical protein